jgi:hypothetical protein
MIFTWMEHRYNKINIFYFSLLVNHAVQEPKAIAQAPKGEGCPRCGGYVYAAEQMLALGRVSIFTVAVITYGVFSIDLLE